MKIQFIILLTAFFLLGACTKNGNHPVPNIPFDVTINLTLPSYSDLQGVSGWAYVNAGSKGVIVYRRGIDEFIAFDRHSPVDVDGSCATGLTPDEENFLVLLDECSDAQFSLYDGSPIQNSDFGLRMYATSWNGNELLRIYN